ncbi:MAG: SH3 domain-containing protein [Proteobacteria bacterium]|nr:SH3 domain-containing protein [Pseudomonadota bacterium]MBU1641384.1 SH3 domain-containing protein [Pseudomonadota bacterium]
MHSKFKISLHCFVLCLLFWPLSTSAKMVSINQEDVNIRSGPSTKYRVKWQVGKGFPLKVIGRSGKWYKIRDFEKDVGWVYAPLTSRKAHLVVNKPVINVRSGPGTNYRTVSQAKYGVVLQTEKRVKGWVKVRHESGVSGWVSRKLLWGW